MLAILRFERNKAAAAIRHYATDSFDAVARGVYEVNQMSVDYLSRGNVITGPEKDIRGDRSRLNP